MIKTILAKFKAGGLARNKLNDIPKSCISDRVLGNHTKVQMNGIRGLDTTYIGLAFVIHV